MVASLLKAPSIFIMILPVILHIINENICVLHAALGISKWL